MHSSFANKIVNPSYIGYAWQFFTPLFAMHLLSYLAMLFHVCYCMLSGRFLKDGSKVLATPITQICNLSIKLSTVPDECKIAKLKPLYKKGRKTDPKNYRPISLLPVISKILEKVIHDQTIEFVTKKNILYKFQSHQVFENFTPQTLASRICKIR